MRFAALGSGSSGNALLVESGGTCLLVDCGFALVEIRRRLLRLGLEASGIDAILITHEHGDHVSGLGPTSRALGVPVYMTRGTRRALGERGGPCEFITPDEVFRIGALEVRAYPVPHDAAEPCQFSFVNGAHKMAMLTDVGHITPHIERCLDGCDALLIEGNYDVTMLRTGPYPEALRARIAGPYGHLDNDSAAAMLERIDTTRLKYLAALHLSEENNSPQRVREAFSRALDCAPEWIYVADQQTGLDWFDMVNQEN